MTETLDQRTAGRLARYGVVRAAATAPAGDREGVVDAAAEAVVASLLAEHGPEAVAALVADLGRHALTDYAHHATALASDGLGYRLADVLEVTWRSATPTVLRYLDDMEADERRGAEREARTGALTAA